MKIELKNVKYAAFASEETSCFSATVYIDGVKAGTVSNEGRGGPDRLEPRALFERINAYAATLPPIDVSEFHSDGQHTMPQSSETLIGNILNAYLTRKDLMRLCSKKVLFRIPGETYEEGEYRTLKVQFSPAVKAQLVAKYGPSVEILNETLQ